MNIVPGWIVLAYGMYGIFHMILNYQLKQWYMGLMYFIVFKMIFNYKKCTLSFFECKFRGVKKENGYLYRFMDKFINLRYEPLFSQ